MTATHTMDDISHGQLGEHLEALEERLISRYPAVPAEVIRRFRRSATDRFATAKVHVFVPILVERAVREHIARWVTAPS
jgi:hypothetical protein